MSKRSNSSFSSSEISYIQEAPRSPASLLSKKEQKVLGNARELAWLQRQIEDMDKELDPRIPEQLPCQNITTDELYDYRAEIDVKRSELLNVSNYIAHKEQILSIVQHEQFVKEVLYPSASDSMDELQYKRTVQDTLTQLVKLAMEHMKELEPCLEERKQLIDIRKEISQVEETNMELFQTCTRDPQEPFENKTQLLSLLEREAQLQTQVELTRKVLLGVIVESRIDWSNDKKLTNLVLKLGDDFDVVGRKQLLRELKQHDHDIDLPDAVKEESFMSDTQSVTTDGMSMDQIIV